MRVCGKSYDQSRSTQCNLCFLGVSVVNIPETIHHRAQRTQRCTEKFSTIQRRCLRINVAIFQASIAFQGIEAIV